MTTLRAGELEAVWLPEHGMVGASLRHRGEELLGRRGGLEDYLAKGSAFGIPLLAPWANRLDGLEYGQVKLDPERVKGGADGLPKDGAMAGRAWTVEEADERHLVASFLADEPVLAVFPFPHRLHVAVTLDPGGLTVRTTLAAVGVVPVPVAFGWHPLFTLPGVAREALQVTLPVLREVVLDDRGIPTGEERDAVWDDGPLGGRTLDSEYNAWNGDAVLRGGGRELRVRFGPSDGYAVAHAWAPAGEAFLAWEPMTAPTNALVSRRGLAQVLPGASTSATFSVLVR